MVAPATRKIVASDVEPTATPSIGTGKASASVAAAIRSAIPAPSRQPRLSVASDATATTSPAAPANATGAHTPRAARELASRCARCDEAALARAGARDQTCWLCPMGAVAGCRIPGQITPPSMPRSSENARSGKLRTMRIVVGADDQGPVADTVVAELRSRGHDVTLLEHDRWPDVAERVARAVAAGEADQGVLFCWTGTGTAMAANKVPGVRAASAWDPWI